MKFSSSVVQALLYAVSLDICYQPTKASNLRTTTSVEGDKMVLDSNDLQNHDDYEAGEMDAVIISPSIEPTFLESPDESKHMALLHKQSKTSRKLTSSRLSSFADEKGYDKISAQIDGLYNKIDEEKGTDWTAISKVATGTVNEIENSISKFENGDPILVAQGVIDIASEASQVVALVGGPKGQAVAAILKPVLSLVSFFLGMGVSKEVRESQEDMITRIFTRVLNTGLFNLEYDHLKAEAEGLRSSLMEKMNRVTKVMVEIAPSNFEINWVLEALNVEDSDFLAKIWIYIERDLITNDHVVAARVAETINLYTALAYLRYQVLTMGQTLLFSLEGENFEKFNAIGDGFGEQASNIMKDYRKKMKWLAELPTANNNVVYAKILLMGKHRFFIETMLGKTMPGEMVMMRSLYHLAAGQYLYTSPIHATVHGVSEAFTANSGLVKIEDNMFVKYEVPGKPEEYQIFGIGFAGYLYAADLNPVDANRRRVYAVPPGIPFWPQNNWKIEKSYYGTTIFDTHHNEYLYCAWPTPFNAYAFTWRPGTKVSNGEWSIESGPKHLCDQGDDKYEYCVYTTYPECNWQCYLDRYSDLRAVFGNDHTMAAKHYRNYGEREGRNCNCNVGDYN